MKMNKQNLTVNLLGFAVFAVVLWGMVCIMIGATPFKFVIDLLNLITTW